MFENFGTFITDGYIRTSWIAFLTLWVLWGLMYSIRHAVGDPYSANGFGTSAGVAPTTGDDEVAASKSNRLGFLNNLGATSSIATRFWNSHRLLKENTFMLLSVLVINTFSKGSTRAVFIMTWIFFAFTVFFALVELVWSHRFLRLAYSIMFYGFGLTIAGLAFQLGW